MIELSYDPECGYLPSREVLAIMEKAAVSICEAHGLTSSEISLSFVSEEAMKSLNYRYRNISDVTDVLSFPQFAADEQSISPEPQSVLLGDIVICTERARQQAEEYEHSERRELLYLFVHGLLHLLGYDHEDEAARKLMREKEEATMAEIGEARS